MLTATLMGTLPRCWMACVLDNYWRAAAKRWWNFKTAVTCECLTQYINVPSDNFGKLIKIMIFHCVWAMVHVDMGGVVCVQVHAKSRGQRSRSNVKKWRC